MTKSLASFKGFSKAGVDNNRWQLYFVLGIFANAAIWGSALLFLKVTPATYKSQYAISLPDSGSNTNINIPNIGTATYNNVSPFATVTQDPRENYKLIADSNAVIKAAASELDMPLQKFGKPKIKIVRNTTIMEFELQGTNPEEAYDKAWALYKALEARVKLLRSQEMAQRDASFQAAFGSVKLKLEIAQKRLSDFQARSGLSSSDQIKDLSTNIEQLRRQRAELFAQQKQYSTRLAQLSANLNISPQQATDAFVLQSDQLFQQNSKDYSDASSALVVLSSKFKPNHPTVVSEKAKQNAAQTAMLVRGQSLLGRPVSQANIQQFNLSSTNSDSARDTLFQQLVAVHADKQGLKAQAQETDLQITQLDGRLKVLAQQTSTLQALQRDVQVAEALFSSTLARLDLGKSNIFASYPLMQVVAEPSLPKSPLQIKNFVLIGAALGSIFLTNGLVLLSLRKSKTETPK